MRASVQNLSGSCGLGVLYGFNEDIPGQYTYQQPVEQAKRYAGGTGFFVAAFVNSKVCKKTFEELVANNKVVMQAPVRRNENSGRGFFFCIFDRSNRKRLGYTPAEAVWPWKSTRQEY